MASSNGDPVIQAYRAQIAALDQEILAALNRRIALVKGLKDHKTAQGLDLYDGAQEAAVLANLHKANPGPLSREAVDAVFGFILEWAKREATRLSEPSSE